VKRYVLDTNVYIEASRSAQRGAELANFVAASLPFTYLSAIVVLELLAGAVNAAAAHAVRDDIVEPYERVGRVVTPTYRCYATAGEVLADLSRRGWTPGRAERGFVNDTLLAASCLEGGFTLVTWNTRDFERIRTRLRGFQFVEPHPA
jgi:predicted nucleic acid-binding protein